MDRSSPGRYFSSSLSFTTVKPPSPHFSAERDAIKTRVVRKGFTRVGSAHREISYKDLTVFHHTQFEPQFLNRRSVRLHDYHLDLASPASKKNPFQQGVMPTTAFTAMKQLFQEWPAYSSTLLRHHQPTFPNTCRFACRGSLHRALLLCMSYNIGSPLAGSDGSPTATVCTSSPTLLVCSPHHVCTSFFNPISASIGDLRHQPLSSRHNIVA